MEALLTDNAKGGGALSQTQLQELRAILESLRSIELPLEPAPFHCCTLPASIGTFRDWLAHAWPENTRPDALLNNMRDDQNIESIVFEDQDGEHVKFADFFYGQPSVVVFFYTRCTNPLKCSLTITKLARLQKLLAERRLDGRICTAAITYDPEFDLAERLRGYGGSRGVRMDGDNRLLRAVEGIEPLRKYFRLGVNFIQSIVNRHRVELYVLDAAGRIAASFERIQWDENEVLERAAALLAKDSISAVARSPHSSEHPDFTSNALRGRLVQRSLRLLHSPQQPGAFPAHMRAADQRYEDCRPYPFYRSLSPSFQSAPSAGPHISAFSVLPAWSNCLTPPGFCPFLPA